MNLRYNILWFEDNEMAYHLKKDLILPIVEEFGFDFHSDHELDGSNIDSIDYGQYDLIIADLNIGEETGVELLRRIRGKRIYTEVLFYSTAGENAIREELKIHQIDGVYCSAREDSRFASTAKSVIQTLVKKVFDINNMRGLVMASVSNLDSKMESILEYYFLNSPNGDAFLEKEKARAGDSL